MKRWESVDVAFGDVAFQICENCVFKEKNVRPLCSKGRLSAEPRRNWIFAMPSSVKIVPSIAKGAEIMKKMRAPDGALPALSATEIKVKTKKRPKRRKTVPRSFRIVRIAFAPDVEASGEPGSLTGSTSGVFEGSDIDDSGKDATKFLKNSGQGR